MRVVDLDVRWSFGVLRICGSKIQEHSPEDLLTDAELGRKLLIGPIGATRT